MGMRVGTHCWLFSQVRILPVVAGTQGMAEGWERARAEHGSVNFQPKKSGFGKEVLESHQELFSKRKDMSCTLGILEGTFSSLHISASVMTWGENEMGLSFH